MQDHVRKIISQVINDFHSADVAEVLAEKVYGCEHMIGAALRKLGPESFANALDNLDDLGNIIDPSRPI